MGVLGSREGGLDGFEGVWGNVAGIFGQCYQLEGISDPRSGAWQVRFATYEFELPDFAPGVQLALARRAVGPLRKGDKVTILESTDSLWWRGSVGSRRGLFPCACVDNVSTRDDEGYARYRI